MKKTMSFAFVHYSDAFSVAYLMSGRMIVGGAIALVEPAINTIAFHLHEKTWNRFSKNNAVLA